ncbi:hypothetical protein ACFFX0_23320 [Citricoccus parietis]|uniref:Uncharacterized protein n=1 Tax=Citricoccus parietis TaxID=592307 RepID=A0ABV5G285_9MICC
MQASSYWARYSSFCAGVKDLRGLGPPARGPGLLMDPSWPTSAKARFDIMIGFLFLALRDRTDLLCHRGTAPA